MIASPKTQVNERSEQGLTNGRGVCSSDSRQVVSADREAGESIWITEVLLCQFTGLDAWSGHDIEIEIHLVSSMTLQLCCKALDEMMSG